MAQVSPGMPPRSSSTPHMPGRPEPNGVVFNPARRHTIAESTLLGGATNSVPPVMILDQNSIPQIDRVYNHADKTQAAARASLISCGITGETPLMIPTQGNDLKAFVDPTEGEGGAWDGTMAQRSFFGFHKDSVEEANKFPSAGDSKQDASTREVILDHLKEIFKVTDNKLAMKMFGNRQAVLKERKRQEQTSRWIIHPCSAFRFYWDMAIMLILIINLLILPVAISFFYDDLSAHWIAFNSITDTILIIDIFINFRTGVASCSYADEVILQPREIARRYLKSWFALDMISSLPIDYIILIFSSAGEEYQQILLAGRAFRIFRVLKLLSLLRLLRLSRLVRYLSQWEEFLSIAGMFMRIFNLICLMLLLCHWNGCIQFLIPMFLGFPEDSWVTINELQDADWTRQYTRALFKALSHMLCIGYGRFPPQGVADTWTTVVSMLLGATCYALFIGHATTVIQSFDYSKRVYGEKMQLLEEYMSYRKLPKNLRLRIMDYYEHKYHGKMFDENCILTELNECLREEIVNYNSRDLVAKVPFFSQADPQFVSDVINKLQYEVFQPGDHIIKAGTMGTGMYFIQVGIVDILSKEDRIITTLMEGSYFGEICLLTNAKRVASVRAETYCNVYFLHRDHFNEVLASYPVMRVTMERVAQERLHKIESVEAAVVNDDLEWLHDEEEEEVQVSYVVGEIPPQMPTIMLQEPSNGGVDAPTIVVNVPSAIVVDDG